MFIWWHSEGMAKRLNLCYVDLKFEQIIFRVRYEWMPQ